MTGCFGKMSWFLSPTLSWAFVIILNLYIKRTRLIFKFCFPLQVLRSLILGPDWLWLTSCSIFPESICYLITRQRRGVEGPGSAGKLAWYKLATKQLVSVKDVEAGCLPRARELQLAECKKNPNKRKKSTQEPPHPHHETHIKQAKRCLSPGNGN